MYHAQKQLTEIKNGLLQTTAVLFTSVAISETHKTQVFVLKVAN